MISSNKAKGFTLVELLIVIVVIGILAAISVVAYNGITQKARDDQRITDARNVLSAISSYQAEHGEWLTHQNISTKLGTFTTVKVPSEVLAKVGDVVDGTTNKDKIKLETCNGGNGVKLTTWSEAKGQANDPIVAGDCS